MTLQEQLAQPQTPPVFSFPDRFLLDQGLLGNTRAQTPAIVSSVSFATGLHSRPVVASISADSAESSEMDWLEENALELGRHSGEWLLIRGRELLVHSRDFADLRAAIHERQISSPFVYYVPTDEETNSVTI